jgi:Rap1a immunity proteins
MDTMIKSICAASTAGASRKIYLWAILVMATLAASLGPLDVASGQENLGSSNYMLPLCKTWLKIAVDHDKEEIVSILKTKPTMLTSSGVCAGVVIGIFESLRAFELSCPPNGVTNDQLVRMIVSHIERHPEKLNEDFVVPVSAVMVGTWPCKK